MGLQELIDKERVEGLRGRRKEGMEEGDRVVREIQETE
jgi:hypothetical protein